VLLKPNILSGNHPDKAVTTHPEFVRAAIRLFRELGAGPIYVGDSPSHQPHAAAARKSGIFQAVAEEGAVWADFNESPPASVPGGARVSSCQVAPIVRRVDMIVSLPKMKTHQLMLYTGAMKNLFGVIPGVAKAAFHARFADRANFARMLVELNLGLKPGFALMDAVVGMEGPGPGNGYPRRIGLVLASPDVLAMDVVASSIMGYNPLEIPTIAAGIATKAWIDSVEDAEARGVDPASVRMADFKRIPLTRGLDFLNAHVPGFLYDAVTKALMPKPVFVDKRCARWGACVTVCPVKALSLSASRRGGVSVDYSKFLRCYCCHEICPADAILIRRRL